MASIPEIQKFRAKYPDYNDIDDATLAGKLAQKYPDAYADLPKKVAASVEKPSILQRAKGWVKDAAEGMMAESDMAAEASKRIHAPKPVKKVAKEVAGFGEGALSTATQFTSGMAGQAVAGLSGLNTLVGLNPEKPALDLNAAREATEEALTKLQPVTTYTPQTAEGEKHAAAMSTPFSEWSRGSQIVGNALVDAGHPTAGAVIGTGLELAPFVAPILPHVLKGKGGKPAKPVTDPNLVAKLEETPETPRPTHENLGEGVTAKDSLSVPSEVKPVVKGTADEMSALQIEGALDGKVLHQKGDAVYAIDPKAVDVEQAKVAIEQGGDAESAVLGYPPRDAVPVEQRADAAVTKQGEVVTDLPTMKAETEAGNVAWAAEGEKGAVEAKAQEVAGAVKGDTASEYKDIYDQLSGQTFHRSMKGRNGFATESDFQTALRDQYPSVAGMPKAEVLEALAIKAGKSKKKLTPFRQQILDAFEHDLEGYRQKNAEVEAEIAAEREAIQSEGTKGDTSFEFGVEPNQQRFDGDQGKMFATPPEFGRKTQGRGVVEENPMWTEMKEREAEQKQTSFDADIPPEQPPVSAETPMTGNIAAGSLAYGQELPKYAGNINLDRVGADYSVKKLILDTSDQYKPMIDESRRGIITHEETKALADDLGMTVEDLLQRRKGQAFNAEEVTAARDILNTSATRLNDIRAKAAELGSDEALIEFRKAFDTHALIQAEVSGAAAEAGRALSAHRMSSSPSKNYKAMLDALGGREVNEAILRRFGEVDVNNVQEVNRFIKEFTRVKKRSMIYEAWMSFLLSGVKTHVVNTVSNVLTFGTKPLETLAVSGVEAVRRTVKGDPRTRFVGEMKHELIGAKAGISDGVTGALRAWREELPADTLVKFDSPSPYGGAIPGKTGKIIRIPLRLLSAADEFMKSVVYTGEIYGQSYRQARIEGLTGEQLKTRMIDLVSNPSEKIRKIAHHEAEYRTFTQPLGPYANKINSLRQLPGGRVLVPFFRTLTNIAKFGLERTPFNFVRLASKIRKGELKGAQISDELAKPILGTLIAAAVVELSSQGMITGGGPKKKEDRETLFRSGWQPYSFKVGDKYIPFGRIEPIGTIFGMSADFVEIANSGADDKTLSDYAEAISLSFTKNLLSKTFVTGVSNALDAVTDPKRYGAAWIKSQAGSLVPSISANVAQVVDPVMRQTNSPLDAMQARVPYLSQNLPAKVDIWGREIKRAGNAFERAVSPSPVTESTKDPVDLEVTRLGMSVGLPKKQIGKVKLSPYEYEIYAKRSGQRAYNNVSRLVGVGMSDESKIKAIERAISNARTIEGKKLLRELRK